VLEEGGYGRFVGRIKEVIIKVCNNIFPVFLEEFFLKHPDIMEAVVRQE
jgi:acyl-CoA synthetase (AMP-forming)/AMP-acid ligase II